MKGYAMKITILIQFTEDNEETIYVESPDKLRELSEEKKANKWLSDQLSSWKWMAGRKTEIGNP